MPKDLDPSSNEKAFVLDALKQNLRLDGRDFESFRDLELSFGEDYGLADVRLGKTRYTYLPRRPPLPKLIKIRYRFLIGGTVGGFFF